MNPIDYRVIPVDELVLNVNETAKRLQTSKEYENEKTEECLKELRKAVNCKFSAVRTKIDFSGDNLLNCGFGEFESKMLVKNLSGCNEAFIFAVTLGIGVDRLLTQLSLLSPSKHFITDALASSMAEAATDRVEELIKGSLLCKPRFSPGFGDLSLELQPKILNMLNAQRLLGITTNSSLLMSPRKSVTAIMGIEYE